MNAKKLAGTHGCRKNTFPESNGVSLSYLANNNEINWNTLENKDIR